MPLYHARATPQRNGWDLRITGPEYDHTTYADDNAGLHDLPRLARAAVAARTGASPQQISITLSFDPTPDSDRIEGGD